jgi:hypothetical protein
MRPLQRGDVPAPMTRKERRALAAADAEDERRALTDRPNEPPEAIPPGDRCTSRVGGRHNISMPVQGEWRCWYCSLTEAEIAAAPPRDYGPAVPSTITGVVTGLHAGYGFMRGEGEDVERFFLASALQCFGPSFDSLRVGDRVRVTPIAEKVVRGLKTAAAASAEQGEKRKVRTRDRTCRFPRCGCQRFKLTLAVCHTAHKGMGGNPARDRSVAPLMILFCSARHRENRISLDRGTVRVRPLTDKLFGGACAFDVDTRALTGLAPGAPQWTEVGRETARHTFEPFTPAQLAILDQLRGMEV